MFLLLACIATCIPSVKAQIEDFTTWTEIDSNSHLSQTSSRASFTGLAYNEDAYLYKSYGAGFFNGDFIHHLTIEVTSVTSTNTYLLLYALSNSPADRSHIILETDMIIVSFRRKAGSKNEFRLRGCYDGESIVSDTYEGALATPYYCTLSRIDSDVTFKMYSDSERTVLVTTMAIALAGVSSFQYITTTGSNSGSVYTYAGTGYVENLDLGIVYSVSFYHSSGGTFRVNNATMANETEHSYGAGTVLELLAIVEGNLTYGFNNFTWDASYNISNPYDLTVSSNLTVWCYFEPFEAGYSWLGIALILGVCSFLMLAIVLVKD